MNAIQADWKVRIVATENLEAMAERISGMCHRFSVTYIGNFALVEYSNPDEYGNENPMIAYYPMIKGFWGKGTVGVVMNIHKVINDSWDGEGWQAFSELDGCPQLFRGENGEWDTREEIEKAKSAI